MQVHFDIQGADSQGRVFLTWTPTRAQARLIDAPVGSGPIRVRFRNAGSGGQLVFDTAPGDQGQDRLEIDLPADGAPVSFWIAGQFGQPSLDFGDAAIEAIRVGSTEVLGTQALMVRIRKNADKLTSAERDRFLDAMATLNAGGMGRFKDFRDMHVYASSPEAHGNSGFLPWHRAYILDLERELQAIDAAVALPYWRFDEPAPNLFSRRFIGLPNSTARVEFSAGHPLNSWSTDGQAGIQRSMGFSRQSAPPGVRNELVTLALGGAAPNGRYGPFQSNLEFNPHGEAHVSFGDGFITSIPTAARDPVFFLLHCNVDRLWGKWQWINNRMDSSDADAYAAGNRIGHRLNDTMWPWNGATSPPRPPTAPGGGLASSPATNAPGASPRVRDMLDYQGVAGGEMQNFAYDDVPFDV